MPDDANIRSPATVASDGPAAFPEGSRILHIGPPKTGTTALQAACWNARAALLQQGLRYAGGRQHAPAAARAVTGQKTITSTEKHVPSIEAWTALVRELDAAREPRVLYSSEALAEAGDDAISQIARDVGPGIQVLVTLRSVDAVLASQWQQSVQSGSELGIEAWLRLVLGDPHGAPMRLFRQGDLVRRWADALGPGRVTVIVLDRQDPGFLFRTAEALFALRPGTLIPSPDQANRSLSLPEVEVIRRMNVQARAAGVGNHARAQLVTFGAAAAVKRRPAAPDAETVRLPAWAAARATEIGRETYSMLGSAEASTGVRVIGRAASLVPDVPGTGDDAISGDARVLVDADTAATLAMGVAWGTGLRLGSNQPSDPDRRPLTFVPTRVLVRMLVARGLERLNRSRKAAGLGRG